VLVILAITITGYESLRSFPLRLPQRSFVAQNVQDSETEMEAVVEEIT
jgi:hypothetical protein